MATILVSTLPLSSATNASLKLASSLRSRGHTVIFIGIPDGAAMIEQYGYQFIAVYQQWFPIGFTRNWVRNDIGNPSWRANLKFLLNERKKLLAHEAFINFLIAGGDAEYLAVVQSIQPDLILLDATLHTHWALLAYRSGVKCMYYNPGLPVSEDPVMPPLHTELTPGIDRHSQLQVQQAWQKFHRRRWRTNKLMSLVGIADWIGHLRQLARAFGYPLQSFNTRTELMPLLDWPMLVMCPEAFEFAQARNRPDIHYAEAFIEQARKEPAFPWHKIDANKTLVYCSLGSIATHRAFYQRVIHALAKEPSWQLVLNLGVSLSADDFQDVPADAILVNGAPQLALLSKAAVMLTHGGIGTVKECVYFAVPQIVFPIYFDQFGSAARVKYHGVGAAGSFTQSSADEIHALLKQTLADSKIKSRLQAMSQIFQEVEKAAVGAVFVEKQLGKLEDAVREPLAQL